MRVKKLRRKCDVRGCRNYETYTLTRVRESGNSVIICKSCLEDALKAVKEYPAEKRKSSENAPQLFYENADNEKTAEARTDAVETLEQENDTPKPVKKTRGKK